jgi:hypothetical protein
MESLIYCLFYTNSILYEHIPRLTASLSDLENLKDSGKIRNHFILVY